MQLLCAHCGSSFDAPNKQQRYCCRLHKNQAHELRRGKREADAIRLHNERLRLGLETQSYASKHNQLTGVEWLNLPSRAEQAHTAQLNRPLSRKKDIAS